MLHHGLFQATGATSLNTESGRIAHSGFFLLQHTTDLRVAVISAKSLGFERADQISGVRKPSQMMGRHEQMRRDRKAGVRSVTAVNQGQPWACGLSVQQSEMP